MRKFLWVAVSAVLMLSGFIFFSAQQKSGFEKALVRARSFSTGLAQVSVDTLDVANLVEHSLKGAPFPNGLYQTFIGLHYESMGPDSVLHSSVARTHGQTYPGDRTDWLPTSYRYRSGAEADTYSIRFTNFEIIDFLELEQLLIVPQNLGRAIELELIAHTSLDSGDTIKNAAMVFGYDADIGSPTGGYGDDRSEAILSDSLELLYAFDETEDLFTGFNYSSGGTGKNPGNMLNFHQTVNRSGASMNIVDSVLLDMMQSPQFDAGLAAGDVSLYWVVSLGSYAGTISDTVRFTLVNGRSRGDIRNPDLSKREVENDSEEPFSFELSKNFPNPFNPTTTITYRLQRDAVVDLSVFNLLGQKVRTLVNGRVTGGTHVLIWDGKNDEGRVVSTGVYFYRLQSDRQSITRKMMFLK